MTSPIRVPELGPSLGKLVTGTRRAPNGVDLEPVRIELATRIIDCGGEARGHAAEGENEAALESLGRNTWVRVWEEAAQQAAERLTMAVAAHLEAEAKAVKMNRKFQKTVLLDDVERRAIAARLGSAGAELVVALDDLETRRADMSGPFGHDPQTLIEWQQSVTRCARRLEAAWLALEHAVDGEIANWLDVGTQISQWRRPLWPVLVFGTLGVCVAVWVGAVWGGVVTGPPWLLRVFAFVEGLLP